MLLGALPRELEAHSDDEASPQLAATHDKVRAVVGDPNADLSHSDCRAMGDCLIAIEAAEHATHAISTNMREWKPLSRILGYECIRPEYPDETTQ